MTEMPTTSTLHLQQERIMSCFKNLLNSDCEEEFLRYISKQEPSRLQWLATESECKRLRDKLDSATKDISVLESKLQSATRMIDEERMKRRQLTQERNTLSQQLSAVRRILSKDYYRKLPENAKKELKFLDSTSSEYVDAESGNLRELSKCTSLLNGNAKAESEAEISFSDSDNDLSDVLKPSPAKRASFAMNSKERRSTDIHSPPDTDEKPKNCPKKCLVMSTPNRTNMNKHDNFLMEQEMSPNVNDSSEASTPTHHNFICRTFMMPESCTRCFRKIAFGRTVFKCTDCAIVVHPECRDDTLHLCKSFLNSPKISQPMGLLSDYLCSSLPPFIPSVVAICVREIERRGMQESRLYGMLGNSSLVDRLLNDIRSNKEIRLNLVSYDTHTICRVLMNFFEHLTEPLIPRASWKTFADAVINDDRGSCDLMHAVSTLPRVSRDTLAFIVLHVHNVILISGRSIEDMAVIFSTIIFGHGGRKLFNASTIVRGLILLPDVYWSSFISTSSAVFTTIGSPARSDYVETLLSPAQMKKKRFFHREPSF